MIDKKNITGIILAGGKSSRMGSDKGFLVLNKLLFIEHIINALIPFANNIIIVTNNTNYNEFGYKRVNDIIRNSGPVGGIYTGLHHTKTKYNIVLSCDVPLINSEVLKKLINSDNVNYDVTQIETKENTMPLIALYKKDCITVFEELLRKGEKRLQFAINQMNTKTIRIDSTLEQYVENINTPEQLKEITA